MRFSTLLKYPADWMTGGQQRSNGVVVSSRIRLARNLCDEVFPSWAKPDQRMHALDRILPAVEALPEMERGFSKSLDSLSAIDKRVLVERHLISREQAGNANGSAVVINRSQSLSIMINEEDHLRIQAIFPGFDLEKAYDFIDRVDSSLEQELDYAFDTKYGYLTSCPSNLGTGMRASVMLHLPGLVLSHQIGKVIAAANRIGLAVRGIFGEGSEAQANLFQVSNQRTLGESERDIIERLQRVIERTIRHELAAREKLLEDNATMVRDQIGRAYANLRFAHVMTSKEALNQLSLMRLGMDCGLIPEWSDESLELLLMEIQPAHLQLLAKETLSPEQRDVVRAELLRTKLKSVPEPDMPSDSDGTWDATSPSGDETR
ncbi:protein arginine kinase [Sulfuriroseicoccus oceanibius]|uniref:Protein-arginine kinase n=2 Tax=Sulfuriroseicoccus oceanibius TaxID=2707525 RepID=A0A6B3LBJ9_9BACT|nr:protein arginine kinase [Sulfuriroseicoccus oceanibius]